MSSLYIYTGPTIITAAPVVEEVSLGSSVSVTLNLNRTVVSGTPSPMVTITPSGPSLFHEYSGDQLIVTFTGLNESIEYEYSVVLNQSDQPVNGIFVTGKILC